MFYCFIKSDGFRPVYARLHELRAFVPSRTPLLATVTKTIRDDVIDKLDIVGCEVVCVTKSS